MKTSSTQKAYDEGMSAATYSYGIAACTYDFGTNEFEAWLNGYRYQYARG